MQSHTHFFLYEILKLIAELNTVDAVLQIINIIQFYEIQNISLK